MSKSTKTKKAATPIKANPEQGKPAPPATRAGAIHIPPTLEKPLEYVRFVKWIATPSTDRDPATQKELAEQMGVNEATLVDWKKVDGFWESVRKEINEYFRADTALAIQALKRTVLLKGTAPETKLYLQIVGHLKEDSEITLPEGLLKAIEKINHNI